MSALGLSYTVVTPVRNELENLGRLAGCLAAQTARPEAWVVVDTGSTDGTPALAASLAREHAWIQLVAGRPRANLARGGPIVEALQTGLAALERVPDVVVKLDADVSFEPDYFERVLGQFAADPALGIASGTCYERRGGVWRQRHVTGTTVWGACRAYRSSCLRELQPLEVRMGWDGIDEAKANVRGWRTRTFTDLPFRHHRVEGERDGSAVRARLAQGRAARYMGYRPWYLALRALHHARREPAALAMIGGFAAAIVARDPRCADPLVRAYVRRQQRFGSLPLRLREAWGRRAG